MGLKTALKKAKEAVGFGTKKEAVRLLPVQTTWDAPEAQALLQEVLQNITPHEVDAMLRYKKAHPKDYKTAIEHVKDQL